MTNVSKYVIWGIIRVPILTLTQEHLDEVGWWYWRRSWWKHFLFQNIHIYVFVSLLIRKDLSFVRIISSSYPPANNATCIYQINIGVKQIKSFNSTLVPSRVLPRWRGLNRKYIFCSVVMAKPIFLDITTRLQKSGKILSPNRICSSSPRIRSIFLRGVDSIILIQHRLRRRCRRPVSATVLWMREEVTIKQASDACENVKRQEFCIFLHNILNRTMEYLFEG